ncbi:hypothetical protein MMC15_007786 [Xylographa vitiligo]|nr:hypothetical protein [Xylographa vitiligo]
MADANPIPQLPSSGFDPSHPATVALEDAASTGNVPCFKSILASASDPKAHLMGLVFQCAITGGVPIWKIILSHEHTLMDAEIGHHGSILGLAVNRGDVKLIKYLFSEGVDVDHAHWVYKPVLPFTRDIGASKEIVDLLIAHGATMKTSVYDNDQSIVV